MGWSARSMPPPARTICGYRNVNVSVDVVGPEDVCAASCVKDMGFLEFKLLEYEVRFLRRVRELQSRPTCELQSKCKV